LTTILNPILDASHTRDRRISPPNSQCYPHTREPFIDKTLSWVKSSVWRSPQHAQWLHGYVGCGKSAIAQTVAEQVEKRGRLAGSFFCFRASSDRGRIARLPTTLAYQLTLSIPKTASIIRNTIEKEPGLLRPGANSFPNQMRRLVYEPFEAAVSTASTLLKGPYLIIIDGLDECEDRDLVEEFITGMLSYFRENPSIPLRFLIASRVEEHIRQHLQSDLVIMKNLVDHVADDDIKTFLRAYFAEEAKRSRVIQSYGKQWPSDSQLGTLIKHVNGSFIFASTFAKYIVGRPDADVRLEGSPLGLAQLRDDDGLTPMERLHLALDINPGLDGLYAHTLSRSAHLPGFAQVIAALTLCDSMSIQTLSRFVGMEKHHVVAVLTRLQSIIQIPGDDITPVTFFHTSLLDFLSNKKRAGRFLIEPTALDSLITQLLSRSEDLPHFKDVVAAPALWNLHMGSDGVALVTILDASVMGEVLQALNPIFLLKAHNGFPGFLADPERSQRFHVDVDLFIAQKLSHMEQPASIVGDILMIILKAQQLRRPALFRLLDLFSGDIGRILEALAPLVRYHTFRSLELCPSLVRFLTTPTPLRPPWAHSWSMDDMCIHRLESIASQSPPCFFDVLVVKTLFGWFMAPDAFGKLLQVPSNECKDAVERIRPLFVTTTACKDICPDLYHMLRDEHRAGQFHVSLASFYRIVTTLLARSEALPSFKPILIAFVKLYEPLKWIDKEELEKALGNNREIGQACVDALSPLLFSCFKQMQELVVSFLTDRHWAGRFFIDPASFYDPAIAS